VIDRLTRAAVDLVPGGSSVPLTYADRHKYISLSLQARLSESKLQLQAIREGLRCVALTAYTHILMPVPVPVTVPIPGLGHVLVCAPLMLVSKMVPLAVLRLLNWEELDGAVVLSFSLSLSLLSTSIYSPTSPLE
jgi:hypothetical protein